MHLGLHFSQFLCNAAGGDCIMLLLFNLSIIKKLFTPVKLLLMELALKFLH